jgi:hypothetical protein
MRSAGAVEADDMFVLVLCPNMARKKLLAGVGPGRDVEHQTADVAEKLSLREVELPMVAVEGLVSNRML